MWAWYLWLTHNNVFSMIFYFILFKSEWVARIRTCLQELVPWGTILTPANKLCLFVDLIHFGYERLIPYRSTLHVTTGKLPTKPSQAHTHCGDNYGRMAWRHTCLSRNNNHHTNVLQTRGFKLTWQVIFKRLASQPQCTTLRISLGLCVVVGIVIKSIWSLN